MFKKYLYDGTKKFADLIIPRICESHCQIERAKSCKYQNQAQNSSFHRFSPSSFKDIPE